MKKGDKILIGVIVLAALLGVLLFMFRGSGREVAVYRNGVEERRFDVSIRKTLALEGREGEENTLVIDDGVVYMSHSTCPDKICVKQGKISAEGETIVCLPHKLVIEIE